MDIIFFEERIKCEPRALCGWVGGWGYIARQCNAEIRPILTVLHNNMQDNADDGVENYYDGYYYYSSFI